MVAVAVQDLEKRYGSVVVLDGVTIEVPDGSFAVLVGPSGCGKSTLLRLLAGLDQPDGGTIRFGTRDVTRLAPRERDVAMVFQSYALYPHLTVRDNLGFGLRLRKTARAEIARRVGEVSAMLGLEPLLDRMPRELSGGQRQRVAMGRAIVRRPSLFMFDEPLSNLDAALRAHVRVDIRKLHQQLETTSVYVTHDQVEAMTLADVMFVLNRGKVEQSGAPLEVYRQPATRFVAGFLGSPAMNFLNATVRRTDGGKLVATLGFEGTTAELALDAEAFGERTTDGMEVTVGIRPHDFVLAVGGARGGPSSDVRESHHAAPGRAAPLELAVGLVEALGGETYAHGTLCGQDVVVRLDASATAKRGDALEVLPTAVHLFDSRRGHSLRS